MSLFTLAMGQRAYDKNLFFFEDGFMGLGVII